MVVSSYRCWAALAGLLLLGACGSSTDPSPLTSDEIPNTEAPATTDETPNAEATTEPKIAEGPLAQEIVGVVAWGNSEPLTIEELSGEILPLIIQGIKDRDIIEKPAVAFWGDTAPDAFVTVNGEPVEVSEYGAFIVDFPLDDGANFIEVLASDFQGRTTSKSFTIVSLQ